MCAENSKLIQDFIAKGGIVMRGILVTVAVLCMVTSAQAGLLSADLGNPDVVSSGVILSGWGEAEPSAAHLGGYGGAALESARMVWGNQASGDLTSMAFVAFPSNILSLDIRHLDGIADDSFTVKVDGVLWGTYVTDPSASEYWLTSTFAGAPGKVLEINSLSAGWWGAAEYGTLAIDKIDGYTPAPGAILLVTLGTGLVGYLRRRHVL